MLTHQSFQDGPQNFYNLWNASFRSKVNLPVSEPLHLAENPSFPSYCIKLDQFKANLALQEASLAIDQFVAHRPGEGHRGWKGLTLHGLSSEKTMCPEDYGIAAEKANYQWTEVSRAFPSIREFFCGLYPSESYGRIRLMMIEPGGFILPHRDREKSHLGPLSIPLNTPKDCYFMVEGFGRLKLRPGNGYLIDISRRHCVWNRSNQPRFHIIAEARYGKRKMEFINLVVDSYPINNRLYFCDSQFFRIKKLLKSKVSRP